MLKFLLDILSTPAILVGFVAFLGLIAQNKPKSETIKGTVKSIMGFLVLSGGAGILVGSLQYFGSMFQQGFNIQGIVPNNEAIVALALKTYGTQTALIMAFGMLMNILIARLTNLKYIFLTGHHTLYMACMIAAILIAGGLNGTILVVVGSVLLGFVMAVFPALAQPTMRRITGQDDIAFAHFGTVGYILSAGIGKLVGKNSKSTEEMNFPQGLTFLRDTSVAISLTMAILYIIVAVAAGPAYIENEISGGQNFLVFAIIQAITFAAGVYVILAGVRLILGEIVPAFKGIASRIVPNAKPALDCPVVYPYAPNAVLIGFLSSFVGGIVGMFILIALKAPVILPGVVPHFFCGATSGVFGNATGGRRGAVIGAFTQGLLITFLPVLLLPTLGNLGFANTTFSDADFGVVGIILGNFLKLFIH
ncbi:PTS ascorbate transporter subunit IIC [Clostridium polyendosporum]|uniref:Ascorbate-specific PTS system EIIC component n=1 Tax=Clostridium polyendosporum TaxID=69208 RepID=A0A919RWG4_9CLOT|nr:PTS ascorbate transporter subunit IIC [Clostridium polyendosporum]GIM27725.1 PTS ascorbate transporter subunit IIC [Clostridium polyendosporum]